MPGCSAKPSHCAQFWALAPNPFPHLASANAPPCNCVCIVQATPSHTSTTSHHHFIVQIQNQTTAARFWVFGPPTPLPLWVCEHTAPQPLLPCVRATQSPPPTTYCCLTGQTQNGAMAAQFCIVSPKHPPPMCAIECPPKPPQPPSPPNQALATWVPILA
jgi:hypothetical protein